MGSLDLTQNTNWGYDLMRLLFHFQVLSTRLLTNFGASYSEMDHLLIIIDHLLLELPAGRGRPCL